MSYGDETETEVGAQTQSPAPEPDPTEYSSPAAYREEYGLIQGTLKSRRKRFASLDRSLTQARITATYDEYLLDSLERSLLIAGSVALFAVIVGIVAVVVPPEILPTVLGSSPATAATLVAVTAATFVLSLVGQYFYPRIRADFRRRRIESALPHAVIFMYALSEGNLNLVAIMRKLAEAENSYGEISGEFRAIVNDIDRFNIDTLTALEEAKDRSPSEEFQEFLDDLISVFGSGGDLNVFLRNRSENQLQTAREQQENFLETLAALVEGYITIVFAGPIFLIVLLVIISFNGPETLAFVNGVTYGFIPLGITAFLAIVHILNTQHNPGVTIDAEDQVDIAELDQFDTEAAEQYRRTKRRRSVREFARKPIRAVRKQPILSLWVTLPLGWLFWSLLVMTGAASPTLDAYRQNAFRVTTVLIVAPIFVPSLGLMLAHEAEQRRVRDIRRRLPEILNGLASANRNGIRFVECIPLVARDSDGVLAQHLRRLDNDIKASRDVYGSLRRFAAELSVPRVSRVTSIIIEGHRSSGTLYSVLEIAAKDTKERARLDTYRSQTMSPYLIFFIIGVFVYMSISLLLTEIFFDSISRLAEEIGDEQVISGVLSDSTDVPISSFETALYHSLLIQAFGNGLVIGKLTDNKLLSGLKYANAMTLIVVVIFYVVAA